MSDSETGGGPAIIHKVKLNKSMVCLIHGGMQGELYLLNIVDTMLFFYCRPLESQSDVEPQIYYCKLQSFIELKSCTKLQGTL